MQMLSGFSHYLQRLTKHDTGPGSFQTEYASIWPAYLYSIAIPPAFIFFNRRNISLISQDFSESILSAITVVDPAIGQHVTVLKSLGRTVEAANYPLFISTMFFALCIPMLLACRIYASRWRVMLSPHPAGIVLVVMIALLYYVLEFAGANFAYAVSRPGSKKLYLDQFGIYCFYEAAFLFLYAVALLIVVTSLLHAFSAGWRMIARSRP